MITVSDFVINFLSKKKIKNIFTVSGGGSIFLCDSLKRSKTVNYISCHHEQAVSFAAESYSRETNNIGAAIVTTGPGGTNTITGVASCWIDSIPTIFISGQVFLNQTIQKTGLRQLGVQEIDIISLVKPITKYSIMIDDANSIKFHLEKAYYEASDGRPGPVWIDIPANIQSSFIDEKKLKGFLPKKSNNKISKNIDNQISKIAKLILKSEKPLLHLGQGVKLSHSDRQCENFINKFSIPFALTWNASDLITSSNKNYIGRPGAFAERGSNFIVQNCDLFLSVGSRLPYMVTGYNSKDFARKAYKITVDIDTNEVNKKSIDFDLRLSCDAKIFIEQLTKKIKILKVKKDWLSYCSHIRKKYPIVLQEYRKTKKYVNSYYFIECLSRFLPSNSTVVTDMGLSFVGTHQALKIKKNQRLYTNSGHAPMGWGLPAAVGASIANKKKNIICLTGDGGLQMNIQELATVMHHKLPLKIFIFNNGGYLTIKQTQELGFKGRIMGSDFKSGLSFPDYKKIAEAHKMKYCKFSNNIEMKSKLDKVLKSKDTVICELLMDNNQEQMPKAINRRDKSGKSIPTTFEDMFPFLNKKDIEQSTYEHYISSIKK